MSFKIGEKVWVVTLAAYEDREWILSEETITKIDKYTSFGVVIYTAESHFGHCEIKVFKDKELARKTLLEDIQRNINELQEIYEKINIQ